MHVEKKLPVIALRDVIVFPNMAVPIFVGRSQSLEAIEVAQSENTDVFLSLQKTESIDYPQEEELNEDGVVASVVHILKLGDGTLKVFVKGKFRAKALSYSADDSFLKAVVIEQESFEYENFQEIQVLHTLISESFDALCKLKKKPAGSIGPSITHSNAHEISNFADLVAQKIDSLHIEQKQTLLSTCNLRDRLEKLYAFLQEEIQFIELQIHVKKRIRLQMDKAQRSYHISEQLKALQKELGEISPCESDDLEKKIRATLLPKEAMEKLLSELEKYKKMNPSAPEASLIANYISYALEMPWGKYSSSNISMTKAERVLESSHYGMEKVKERILEYIAVLKKVKKVRGPIICLVGPPGVGKTSLVKSVAESLSRKFTSASLGGVNDVAEIRGHRRTYIGAMPGKILQGLKTAGTSDPVFLLDEIDKMGSDFRGDPASALLEVLDSEHNQSFSDHYLDIGFDLSRVVFIATANTTNIPHALADRMEIIHLSGYADNEKFGIAKLHLIPKRMKEHHLSKNQWAISDEAIFDLIAEYTYESGVRELDRSITKLMRKAVRSSFQPDHKPIGIKASPDLRTYLGPPKYIQDFIEDDDKVGIATGLAYSTSGGSILKLEAIFVPGGKGEVKITGKLGDVMQESVKAAHSLVLSHMKQRFELDFTSIKDFDIHIHFPGGAVPKDGPSAGIAIYTVISSLISGIQVNRFVAMTGEITLRGEVLPIGGLKEKLLAAIRSGIKTVLVPKKNEHDMEDISDYIKSRLEVVFVSNAQEVLDLALVRKFGETGLGYGYHCQDKPLLNA